MRLRQALIGDRIRSDIACPAVECRQRIDIDFSIADFLLHHAPRPGGARDRGWATVRPAEEAGVVLPGPRGRRTPVERPSRENHRRDHAADCPEQLDAGPIRFRLPTAADLRRRGRPAGRGPGPGPAVPSTSRAAHPGSGGRVEAAYGSDGAPVCLLTWKECAPSAGSTVSMHFDARWFCLRGSAGTGRVPLPGRRPPGPALPLVRDGDPVDAAGPASRLRRSGPPRYGSLGHAASTVLFSADRRRRAQPRDAVAPARAIPAARIAG